MNEILLEYYQGRPKELIKCEGYLREIIAAIKKDHQEQTNIFRSRNVYRNSPIVDKLCVELANFFNVEKVNIYFHSGSINAYTVTTTIMSTSSSRKRSLDAGTKLNSIFHIVVYENVIYHANLTEQELLACILHEIGHNYYYCPISSALTVIVAIIFSPMVILGKLIGAGLFKLNDRINDIIKEHLPLLFNAIELFNNVSFQLNSFFPGTIYLLSKLSECISTGRLPIPTPQSILLYGGEKGADSFAARYGYGAELITGLEKFNTAEGLYSHKFRKSMGPFGSLLEDLTTVEIDLLAGIFSDPHPSNVQRANAICKKLEADLANNDYPPAMKKDLQKEIDTCKKVSQRMLDPKYGGDIKVRKVWYDTLNGITNGHSDLREIFNFYFDTTRF